MGSALPLMINLTIALAVAFGAGVVASWLRLSPVIGYLAAGIIVGPFTPGFVADRELIAALADVGVVLLMFALGVAFSLRDLARVGGPAIGGSLLQVVFTVAGGWLVATWLGWHTFEGLFFGAILAASSSMVILKTLLDRGEIGSSHGRLLLSMSIVQDLVVVVLVAVLPQFTGVGGETAGDVVLPVLLKVAMALAFIAGGAWIGLRYLPKLMDHVAQLEVPELFTELVALIAFGVAGMSAALGLSAALGFRRVVDRVREKTDLILSLTTSGIPGRNLPTDERLAPLLLKPELASYDAGSINLGGKAFINEPAFLDEAAKKMKEAGVKPEIEIFDLGMMVTALKLRDEGKIDDPMHFQFCLGTPWGAPATVKSFLHLYEHMPANATWSIFGVGRGFLPMAMMGLIMGGHIRVGMEDNIYVNPGVLAKTNAELVERVTGICRAYGREVATPAEARRILGFTNK